MAPDLQGIHVQNLIYKARKQHTPLLGIRVSSVVSPMDISFKVIILSLRQLAEIVKLCSLFSCVLILQVMLTCDC